MPLDSPMLSRLLCVLLVAVGNWLCNDAVSIKIMWHWVMLVIFQTVELANETSS
jgi:hypothetical protein